MRPPQTRCLENRDDRAIECGHILGPRQRRPSRVRRALQPQSTAFCADVRSRSASACSRRRRERAPSDAEFCGQCGGERFSELAGSDVMQTIWHI